MAAPGNPRTPPSGPDDDGVRVIHKARAARRSALPWTLAILVVVAAVVAWRLLAPGTPRVTATGAVAATSGPRESATPAPRRPLAPDSQALQDLPNDDPNDLANYIRPGDPEPTGAELIGALNDVGIRTGIGAFNPPGTSPPLEGLAVPEDFELPEGYVRHHQSNDDGVAIEPILMFAPDFTLFDAHGRPIPLPGNRVVPDDLAPPGLPRRRVRIPPSGP